ncbi:rhodanese-like domain-containing protein [Geomonas azotofigens]|uniref:rhodanese-like domain-containing protein n=1 Tax=Geomonas azotofigens TaxID=2843196 RepID=UPI001C1256D0|nr:rhodanese-like domain-containing protein [Geomonas azotofigens]MBU5614327.1 hypothetical protein [Geomonas azotofigens]
MKILILTVSLLILGSLAALAASQVRYAPLTPELVSSGVKIIDIRTEKEWRETGVVKGTLGLTFFREDKSYDADAFLATLKRHVTPNERIAILCRTGNRSDKVSRYLVQHGFTSVTNLGGGVTRAKEAGIRLVPYTQDNVLFTAVR